MAWAHAQGLLDYQTPGSAAQFAVYETRVKHLKPTFFGDDLRIEVQARVDGNKLIFQYRVRGRQDQVCAAVETVHVPLSVDLKLMRIPAPMRAAAEREKWIETWL